MIFRVRRNGRDFDLWPVTFTAADGRNVNAELHCDDRVLLNCSVQNDLIEIANTWGKALAAQRVQHGLHKNSTAEDL